MNSIDEPPEARFRTVGRPLSGNEVKLIDEGGREVSPGEIGIITVKGPYSMGGYYKDLKATRQTSKGGRCNLGDLCRFDEDGRIQIMGRQKEIIIRGGQNIYPKEIENLLTQHPKILEASVVKMPDPVMGEKACAYVAPKLDQRITFEEMVSFLKGKQIALFKLPERLEIVGSLPRVRGGYKVDKGRLEVEIAQKVREEGRVQ